MSPRTLRARSVWLLLTSFALSLVACEPPVTEPADAGAPTDGARPDAAAEGDASTRVDAGALPALDELPYDRWSFVPIPGAVCGNGSTMPIGVDPHEGATELLVMVMGGGACWDADSCFRLNAATHIQEDYTEALFTSERGLVSGLGWDDRGNAGNPFRSAHIVFVPYCSGDLYAGDVVRGYPGAPGGAQVHHRGAPNVQRIVDAMREAWPSLAKVRVIGFSAGGYGTQLNWGRFADAWPDADLALLADSAPLIQPPTYELWRENWNLQLPADCEACRTTFSAFDDYFDARYPRSRLGLMATTRDAVLSAYWGGGDITPLYEPLLAALDDNETTRYFVVDSDAHVILGQALTLRSADGTLLLDWLAGWLDDDRARFHDTRP